MYNNKAFTNLLELNRWEILSKPFTTHPFIMIVMCQTELTWYCCCFCFCCCCCCCCYLYVGPWSPFFPFRPPCIRIGWPLEDCAIYRTSIRYRLKRDRNTPTLNQYAGMNVSAIIYVTIWKRLIWQCHVMTAYECGIGDVTGPGWISVCGDTKSAF